MSWTSLTGQFVFYLFTLRLLYWLLKPLYEYLTTPSPATIWRPSPTHWAVVTGGTDGIGLAYCRALARKGYPLLIISRNATKLAKVQADIVSDFPQCPAVRTLPFDFSLNTPEHYARIERELDSLAPGHVDVLVNNVGVSFTTADYFTIISETNSPLLEQMIHVNVVSVVKVTQMVWEGMITRNRGVVLNIGSQSALSPIPLLALYSATKAFVDYFTHTLVLESRSRPGVIVQSVLPGFVSTKMSHLRPSYRVPTAEAFVGSALARVGGCTRTYGWWWHSIIGLWYGICEHLIGANFNSWLAFNVLSTYRSKYYRFKRMKDTFLQGDGEEVNKSN